MSLRLVTLEEHFLAPVIRQAASNGADDPYIHIEPLIPTLEHLGDRRIAEMDAAGIDLQIISHTVPAAEQFPEAEAVPLARAANDLLALAVADHPNRFAAFATLPTPAPAEAADELERAVTELGFLGAMINGHTRGRFLDDQAFWPIFERAQSLDVPLYLHPTRPPAAVWSAYYADLPPSIGATLSGGSWGWHVDAGMHALRLIMNGVFDEFPGVRVILGHMGEALPFLLHRATDMAEKCGLPRAIDEYVASSLYFTTSGLFTYPPLLCLLLVVGAERVMFSVDYPYSDMTRGRDFILGVPISETDRRKIAHENAERLLGL